MLVDEVPQRAATHDSGVALREAILSLPEKLRLPVILHYMDRVRKVHDYTLIPI